MIAYFAAANINRQTLLYLAHFDDFNSMFNPPYVYGNKNLKNRKKIAKNPTARKQTVGKARRGVSLSNTKKFRPLINARLGRSKQQRANVQAHTGRYRWMTLTHKNRMRARKTSPLVLSLGTTKTNLKQFKSQDKACTIGKLPKQEKVRKIQEAIHLLVKYCMINGEQTQSELSVHRLVQGVIKLHLKLQDNASEECSAKRNAEIMFSQLGGERAAVRNAFNLLSLISLDLDGLSTLESRKARRQLLPHLEALIAHLYKLNETQSEELISHLKDRSLSPNIALNKNKFTDNLIDYCCICWRMDTWKTRI